MKEDNAIALYLRLSLEDNNHSESESIANQRDLLYSYIADNPEFVNYRIVEFVDDGYSGTNFQRPAVANMLRQVRSGKINCIIVKDFSRFGRNFIEVGDYIEQIFPFLGVRFIAVNNHFDSKNHFNSTGTLDIAFKNLINDLYSKDISKKVRSAKQTKMLKGDFMSSGAPFGYRKCADNKNKLEPDPVAAEIVRKIFTMFVENNSTAAIAAKLNADGAPTPLVYKNNIGQGRKWNVIGEENKWTSPAILRIIKDERYTGALVSGKRKIGKVGSNQSVMVSKPDWVIVPDTHEAIIKKELFDEAQERINKRNRTNFTAKPHLFSGLIECGHCRHTLRRRNNENPYFYCETVRYADNGCSSQRIDEKQLCEILLCAVKKHTEIAISAENIFTELRGKNEKAINQASQNINSLKSEFEKAKAANITLYESYKAGALGKEAYLSEKSRAEQETTALSNTLYERECELDGLRNSMNKNQFVENFKKHGLITGLTPEIIKELVSVIRIYDCDTIEIVWNFEDDFQKAVRFVKSHYIMGKSEKDLCLT
jgi:DNA invertase Pin-like site-specific DNA recombinase